MSHSETEPYPRFIEYLPATEISEGKYLLRYARSRAELETILKLRFDIFNLELGEGLAASYHTERDEDPFDAVCHHMVVLDTSANEAIGTYRMQTWEMASSVEKFYSTCVFDLSSLPHELLQQSVELGRACVAKKHRNARVLYLLWRGLAHYMTFNRKRYLFGCCSLTSQDPSEGKRVMDFLYENGHVHETVRVCPQPAQICYAENFTARAEVSANIPRLMKLYLTIGAKICGPPAIDREFKTIDYFTLFDAEAMDDKTAEYFFR